VLHIAVQDHEPGFGYPPERARRGVARSTDVGGLPGPWASAGPVPGQHPLVGADDSQPGVCRRPATTLEKHLRSCQPCAHRCQEGGVEEQVHRDADRSRSGSDGVVGPEGSGVCALPRRDRHIEVAGRIRDLTEQR
jgi:hypothetical protein